MHTFMRLYKLWILGVVRTIKGKKNNALQIDILRISLAAEHLKINLRKP